MRCQQHECAALAFKDPIALQRVDIQRNLEQSQLIYQSLGGGEDLAEVLLVHVALQESRGLPGGLIDAGGYCGCPSSSWSTLDGLRRTD